MDAIEQAWFDSPEEEPGIWLTQTDVKKVLMMLGKGESRIRPGSYTGLDTLEMQARLERVVEMERDDDRG